ncbi:MAG: hypothetical protein WBW73_06030, partial [Rhodoplanes sp.]
REAAFNYFKLTRHELIDTFDDTLQPPSRCSTRVSPLSIPRTAWTMAFSVSISGDFGLLIVRFLPHLDR